MPENPYLPAAMLKRLLTCLALITGLAAVATPATAGFAEAIAEQMQSSAPASQPGKSAECPCASQRSAVDGKKGQPADCRKRTRQVTIVLPTVQFGADRALE